MNRAALALLTVFASAALSSCDGPEPALHPNFPQGVFVSEAVYTGPGYLAAMTLELNGRRAIVSWSAPELPGYSIDIEVRSERSFRWTRGNEQFVASRDGAGLRGFYTWGNLGAELQLEPVTLDES